MFRARIGIIGIVLLAFLAFAHEASAGFIDLIWGASGPQLIGVTPLRCKIDLANGTQECRVFDLERTKHGEIRQYSERSLWFDGEVKVFFSDSKSSFSDSKPVTENDYDAGKAWVVALEPVILWRPKRVGGFYTGAGGTFDIVKQFGDRATDTSYNAGIKIPIGVLFTAKDHTWDGSFVLRLYPKRFTSEQFGFPPRAEDTAPGWEPVLGFALSRTW